ncbi:MAG: hypothetical protein H7144_07495 [Burkholderiales bacterium]|nr:hypothetical protein [Phycisphaerae bacterium]
MPQQPPTHRPPEPISPDPLGDPLGAEWGARLATTLRQRIASELAANFDLSKPMTIAVAPGRLDVMGGVTDYMGSQTIACPINRGTAVAVQPRVDRTVCVFSFNLFDQHKPFTLLAPLHALISPLPQLRREFAEPGRAWAGYVAGCLAVLHSTEAIDLSKLTDGFNIAVLGNVPISAGLGSSASLIAGAMKALISALALPAQDIPGLCQAVENQIVGMPAGPMDHAVVSSGVSSGPADSAGRVWHVVGMTTGQTSSHTAKDYTRFRCAAFIAHALILEQMRKLGVAAGRELVGDPMKGLLSNLALNDYRKFFRSYLPETIKGSQFLLQHGSTIDPLTRVELDHAYPVLQAADFHIFQANRIRNFDAFLIEAALPQTEPNDRQKLLDKAGHLMYAAHASYVAEMGIIDPVSDRVVALVRANEHAGLYGAKLSGRGGSVAILCDDTPRADEAIADIMRTIEAEAGHLPVRIDRW